GGALRPRLAFGRCCLGTWAAAFLGHRRGGVTGPRVAGCGGGRDAWLVADYCRALPRTWASPDGQARCRVHRRSRNGPGAKVAWFTHLAPCAFESPPSDKV